jgi:hypothetical protein
MLNTFGEKSIRLAIISNPQVGRCQSAVKLELLARIAVFAQPSVQRFKIRDRRSRISLALIAIRYTQEFRYVAFI